MHVAATERSGNDVRGAGAHTEARPVSLVLTALVGAAAGTLLGLAAFYPHLLGLGEFTGFMHAVALRGLTLLAALVVLLIAAVYCAFALLAECRRRFCGVLAAAAAVLIITLAALTGFVRGGVAPRAGVAQADGATSASASEMQITVINANVLYTNRSYDDVFSRVDPEGLAIIALQEAVRTQVEEYLDRYHLRDKFALTSPTPSATVDTNDSMLLISRELNPLEIDAAGLPFATAGMITDLGYVYSIHTHAPIARSIRQSAWADSVREALSYCNGNALIAGDFNATVNHRVMHSTDCANSAEQLGMVSAGSWPSRLPSLLGARIDHQYTGIDGLQPVSGEVFKISGSDHNGLHITYAWSR